MSEYFRVDRITISVFEFVYTILSHAWSNAAHLHFSLLSFIWTNYMLALFLRYNSSNHRDSLTQTIEFLGTITYSTI